MKQRLAASTFALALLGLTLPAAGLRAASADDEPELSERDRDRAQRDYDKAVRLVRANKPRDALELFERALPGKNDTSDIFFNLVQVAEAVKRWDKVLAYAQGFLALEPQSSDARIVRSKLELAQKRREGGAGAPVRYRFEAPEGVATFVDHVPVSLDGPGEVLLTLGPHAAAARKVDHKPWTQDLRVKADEPQTLTVTLERILYTGTLQVVTDPPDGVQVYLDDKLLGTTPLAPQKLPTLRVLVRFEKPGYDSWVRYVTPERDQVYELKATLERTRGAGGPH